VAAALASIVALLSIRYGAFVAGGSDAYGYVSEAYGWASGHLPRAYPIPLTLPFASSDWLQTPLGYWPGRIPHTIVPSYAPGLPLLMAAAIRLHAPLGPYIVTPISAALFVWTTFVLARRIAGPVAGLAAAALAASSPVALFMSLWPMSDLPAAAMWTGAAAAAIAGTRRGAIGAGLLAALGILIRPNLAPLALLPWVYIAATTLRTERWRRASIYCAPVAIAAAAVAALNTAWYGSPFLSGYGDPHVLYGLQNVAHNLRRYPAWLLESQSPWILVSALSLIAAWRRGPLRAPILLAWSMVAVTFVCYAAYEQYEPWWYLRFLLPGLGALFALTAVALVVIAERVPRPFGRIAATALFLLIAVHALRFAAAELMYGPFKASEHKYADVGAFIARRMPAGAVFFAMQHSGTIRYYGGRHTLRYDLLDKDAAARAAGELECLGLHPYLAIEDAETADVRKVFGVAPDRPLPWPHVARLNKYGGVSIYDMAAHPSGDAPLAIEPGLAPSYSAPAPIVMPSSATGRALPCR